MKAMLIKSRVAIWYFDDEGNKKEGAPSRVSGDLSRVYGDLSGVSGNLSRVSGDLSGVSGNLSGVYGNLSGVSGNLDECYISDDEREAGINISDLIKAAEK